MSTVLEKPVLLDETGQAIVGKLDDIKEAIENGGVEKYPVLIHVTKMPTKTNYTAGEQLNLSGIEVKAVFSNNVEYDVTSQCVFNPVNGTVLTSDISSVTVAYTWHPTGTSFTATFNINVIGILGIAVITPPERTDFFMGEQLDLSGIEVDLLYDDNTSEEITNSCVFNPANGSILNDTTISVVNISYTYPENQQTYTATQEITVSNPIYGAEWDGSASTAWSRTDDAALFVDPVPAYSDGDGGWTQGSSPFDNCYPWKGMKRVEDSDCGTLVEIPKFYFKWTFDGAKMKLQISPVQQEGFHVSPAHADRGDGEGERPKVYVSAYLLNSENKSVSGATNVYKSGNTWRTQMNNTYNNDEVWQWDYAMYITIVMLYLVEYADWDCQRKICLGYYNTEIETTGQSDDIPYHTGATCTLANKDNYGAIAKYRYIEGMWKHNVVFIDGIYNIAATGMYAGVKIVYNPKDLNAITTVNFSNKATDTGIRGSLTSSYEIKSWDVSSVSGMEWVIFPKETIANSNWNTYVTDLFSAGYLNEPDSDNHFYLYGTANGQSGGMFAFGGGSTTKLYARLMKLPNNS